MLHTKTLTALAHGLARKEYSAVELTKHFLQRIKKFDKDLNSFITITEEHALQQAEHADQRRAQGPVHFLTGIPIAHKDIFCTKNIKTSCASKMLDNFISPYDATIVHKLNALGMVTLGKTNMDEFAMGSSNENSYYGPCKNPWDHTRVPGGSSGGSATAVCARLAPIATGTDTGGSIRQPSALCGLTGIKPTYGRISRYGIIGYASSLDQAGPMALTAEDAAHLLTAMSGIDANDATSLDVAVPDFAATLTQSLAGKTLGIPKEFFTSSLDAGVQVAVMQAIKQFEALGASCIEISLPTAQLAIPAYYVVAPAECSSNLSRYDGVRYGYRCDQPKDLADLYKRTRSEGFGWEVKRRILVGTYVLSSGYYDAYYLKAQKIRNLIKQDFQQALSKVDAIIGPTTPTTAFELGAKTQDPLQMYLGDIYTCGVNLAGLPAISLPCGLHNNLPVGMQLIGAELQEALLLNLAHQYQQVTDWHQQIPAAYA